MISPSADFRADRGKCCNTVRSCNSSERIAHLEEFGGASHGIALLHGTADPFAALRAFMRKLKLMIESFPVPVSYAITGLRTTSIPRRSCHDRRFCRCLASALLFEKQRPVVARRCLHSRARVFPAAIASKRPSPLAWVVNPRARGGGVVGRGREGTFLSEESAASLAAMPSCAATKFR